MPAEFTFDTPKVALAVRTLLVAGFEIQNSRRQPRHIEILCVAKPVLSAPVNYLIAITQDDGFPPTTADEIRRIAADEGRSLIFVASEPSTDVLGWSDFLDALGGAVPSWRALGPLFNDNLLRASKNILPNGCEGEAWRVFEDLVADGLEFCFGRKVRHLGARKRGQRVSDLVTQIPDGSVIVVDAKAAGDAFDCTIANLRPLVEYTHLQKLRQRGQNEVYASLIFASAFHQSAAALSEISLQFHAEAGVPAAFMTAETLGEIVRRLTAIAAKRNALHWRRIMPGGLVDIRAFERELSSIDAQRC